MAKYTVNELRVLAHKKFKMWWLFSHDYTLKDLASTYEEYGQCIAEKEETYATFEEYLEAHGLHGAVWPGFDEFVDCEYQDPKTMQMVLDEDEFLEYIRLEQFEASSAYNQPIRVATERGVIEAYDNNDVDYPGITLSYTLNDQTEEYACCIMEQCGDNKVRLRVYTPDDIDDAPTVIHDME